MWELKNYTSWTKLHKANLNKIKQISRISAQFDHQLNNQSLISEEIDVNQLYTTCKVPIWYLIYK